MGLNKDRLIFTTGDLASSDQVAANIVAGGVEIGETSGALDVNIASSTGLGIFTGDDAATVASLGQYVLGIRRDADTSPVSADGDWHPFIFDSVGRLKTQADIDIKSDVADGAADTENPLKVGTHARDVLTAVDDGDKADATSDLYRRMYVNDQPNIGMGYGALTVTGTVAQVLASPTAGRKRLILQNKGNKSVFIGADNLVTSANGIEIFSGGSLELPFGENIPTYMISDSGSQDVRYMELA